MSESTEELSPLEQRLADVVALIEDERLPGWANYLERDPTARKWLDEQYDKMLSAVIDDDEVLLERAAGGWKKGFIRVNERVAEAYRKNNPDPETWELRFFKWMKIVYMKFESELGDFYLLPRPPRKKPKTKYWYTADEMIDMLHPVTAEAINTFKQLPIRPEELPGPEKGEKHMHVDLTGPVMKVHFDFQGAVSREH